MRRISIYLLFIILFTGGATYAQTESLGYAPILPIFVLNDPVGLPHSSASLSSHSVIFVVTAPILSNKKEQQGWDELLTEEARKRPIHLIFLEDMAPSFFRGAALKRLKKEYHPDSEPVILIDPKGVVRQAFGVKRKQTVILVYDKNHRLIHVEEGEPDPFRAARLWQVLLKTKK